MRKIITISTHVHFKQDVSICIYLIQRMKRDLISLVNNSKILIFSISMIYTKIGNKWRFHNIVNSSIKSNFKLQRCQFFVCNQVMFVFSQTMYIWNSILWKPLPIFRFFGRQLHALSMSIIWSKTVISNNQVIRRLLYAYHKQDYAYYHMSAFNFFFLLVYQHIYK